MTKTALRQQWQDGLQRALQQHAAPEDGQITVCWDGITFARPELMTIHQPPSAVIFETVVFETMLVPIDDETEPERA